jgi:RNA-directed DNA polymerase
VTLRSVFAPLLRVLEARRDASGTVLPGKEWADLLAELRLPPDTFSGILAARSLRPHFHYRHFTLPKKDGGRRSIHEPDIALKRIQREIVSRLFSAEICHPAATAFQHEKSIADHVWAHAGAEVLVTADVRDFFPNTRAGRVEEWWRERIDGRSAQLLTLLTTYQDSIPQGAPTSPGLSNFLNRGLDDRLARRATAARAQYTRYCDDMVFSWHLGQGPPSDFAQGVRGTLGEFGYTLHPTKGWRVHHRRDEPEITGVILTRSGRVRLRDDMRRVMASLAQSPDPQDANRLAGYLAFEAMVTGRPKR